jgi:hypothetical protein
MRLNGRSRSISAVSHVNGSSPGLVNGHIRSRSDAEYVQDAEAFELQGLISEEGESGVENGPRKAGDEESPTVVKAP